MFYVIGALRVNAISNSITTFDTLHQEGNGLTLVLGYIHWSVIIQRYLHGIHDQRQPYK